MVDAGGVAYLEADTLLTEGAQISGDRGTLASVSQILQDVPLTASSYTHLHNGYRTTRSTLATTDVAGLLDLHAPRRTGAVTLLSNHTNLASTQSTSHIVVQKTITGPIVNRMSSSDTTRVTHHGVDTGGLVCEAHDPTFVEAATRMLKEAAPAPILPLLDSTPVEGPLSEEETSALIRVPAPSASSAAPSAVSPSARALAHALNEAVSSTLVRVPTYTPKGTSAGVNLTISLTDAMAADPAVQDFVKRTGATTRIVHDTLEDIHTSQASLGMAPMLLIGIGCFLLMPAGGGMFAVMGKAAVSSMIPQFTNGLVINDGNPFEAFKELTNPDNVRATVLAAATAGVLSHFKIVAPFGSTDLLEHATYAAQSAAVRAPLEMLIARRDIGETIRSNAMGIVANSLGAWAASHIGEMYHPSDPRQAPVIDPFTHQALHFGVGAGTAAILGEDPLAGGAGQVAGEIAGEFYRSTFMNDLKRDSPAWNAAARRGADVARISAIGFATACGLDPSIAAHTAGQAAENNAFMVRVAASATRAVAEVTDSQALHGAADTLEDADQALDRFDEFSNAVDDAVMDMAVTSWNQGIDNAQEGLPQAQSIVQQTLALCPGPYAPLSRAALPVAGAVVKGGLDMLRLPETRTEAAMEAALFVGTAGVGKGLRAAYPYVEPFVLPYVKRAGAYISREAAAMRSALEKSPVFKYFGKKQASVPSSTPRVPATPNASQATSSTSESLVKSETRASSKRGKSVADARRQQLTESGFQEHHIGSHTNKRVKDHPFIEMAGVDLQGRSNKIFLPTLEGAKKSTTTRTIHQGRHDQKVSERIGQQLDKAEKLAVAQNWSREECREALRLIFQAERKHLVSGERILNKHARPGAKDPDLEVCFDSILKARKKD